jgi:hypothetical protein
MKQYHKNPRKITDKQLKTLEKNLIELGDLSGITHEENTDQIITGNQRSKILDVNKCKIEIVEEFTEPDSQGTIAIGYLITPKGQRFNYRKVRWNEEQVKQAAITANSVGGDWDNEVLKNSFSQSTLAESGFDQFEIKGIWDEPEEVEPEVAKISVGSVKFEIPIKDYNQWERKMKKEFQTEEEIEFELLKRLGI